MVCVRHRIIKTVWICFIGIVAAMLTGALISFRSCVISGVVSITISTMLLYKRMVEILKPLSELEAATGKIAEGDLSVRAMVRDSESSDDFDRLSVNINMIVNSLQQYVQHCNGFIYRDALTGMSNKAAYERCRDEINIRIQEGDIDFSVIVMDINNLKIINDRLGHEQGDVLLKRVAGCVKRVFGSTPLFRIGGDEFCAVVEGSDPHFLIRAIQAMVDEASNDDLEWFGVRYQLAAGAATYDPLSDESFEDVFARADIAMYNNKKMLKCRVHTESP